MTAQLKSKLSAIHMRFVVPKLPYGIIPDRPENFYDLIRKATSENGETILEADSNRTVDLSQFLKDLAENGFELVSATAREKIRTGQHQNATYIINFHFVPSENVDEDSVERHYLEMAEQSLEWLVAMNYWHVQAHINPGEEQPWISVSCAAREQRFLGDDTDTPKLVRDRDENGEKIGELHPIMPSCFLKFQDMTVTLV